MAKKLLAGLALTCSAVLLVPGAAEADGVGSGAGPAANGIANQQTPVTSKDGGAMVNASITWTSAQAASVRGSFDDVCPKDTDHAYLTVTATTSSGTLTKKFSDTRSCASAAKSFEAVFAKSGKRKVRGVTVQICESPTSTVTASQCVSRWYDNPKDPA